MTEFLIRRGADPDDCAALLNAVKNNDLNSTRYLSNARSTRYVEHRRGFGIQALHQAVRQQSDRLIDALLSYGIDPNVSSEGLSALGAAIEVDESKDLRLVMKLLATNADPNITMDIRDEVSGHKSRKTALLVAVERRSLPLIELLIRYNANINAPATGGVLHTPLQAACMSGNSKAVELLLKLGAEVNASPAQRNGATALQCAAIKGNLKIASLLLENGASVNAKRAPINGRTALEGAAENRHIDMLQLLINAGARIDDAKKDQR